MRVVIITLGLVLFGCIRLDACSCEQKPPPSEALKTADVVFVGTVISGKVEGERRRHFEFAVKEVLKGKVESKILIATRLGGGDCGYDFIIGREYLVYARLSGGTLYTDICTRTKEFLPEGKKEADEIKVKR